jgi:ABC-2 type transport system permease protein
MRNALLIAGREYAENARTKGFWFNMILFPLILLAAVKVPQFIEDKTAPTRPFMLIDQSGEFEAVIEQDLERAYQRRVMLDLMSWVRENSDTADTPPLTAEQLERIPASALQAMAGDGDDLLAQLAEADPTVLDAFGAEGTFEALVAMARTQAGVPEDVPDFEAPRRLLVRVPLPPSADPTASADDIVRAVKPWLVGEQELADTDRNLFALIVIPPGAAESLDRPGLQGLADQVEGSDKPFDGVQYWSSNLIDNDLPDLVRNALNREIREREFVARGVDSEAVRVVQGTRMRFGSFDPTKNEGEEAVSIADTIRKWAPVGFVYLLWNAIFNVVVMLLNNTVEEKSNRIIEVLLSSATPWEIMSGKLIGIAGVGMTLMGSWILALLGVLKYLAGPEVAWAGMVFDVVRDSGLLPLFVLYFLCGYLIYAGLFLAIGSLCSTVKEAQNFMGTAMIIMMVPMFTMVFIAQDPHGSLAVFLTWVPIYTPFTMMNRAAADPPMFDMIGSIVLMVVTMVVMLWGSAKVFRIGVLRTGQPPKLLELFRQLTTHERER